MTNRAEQHLPRSRNQASIEQHIRPAALIAPEGAEPRTIRVDRPEALDADHLFVHVFPACVQESPVRQQGGRVVRFIVGADEVDVVALQIAAGQNEHPKLGSSATQILVTATGAENDAPVRRVDRVEIVVIAVGDLPPAGAVQSDLVQMIRRIVRGLHAEQHALAVERKVRPPKRRRRALRRQLPHACIGPQAVEHQQPAARRGRVFIAVPDFVDRFGTVNVRIVDAEDAGEVDLRIGQQQLAFHPP